MSVPGFASPDATKSFADKFRDQYSDNAYGILGRTNLTVSGIGFGTYRCRQNNEVHFQAIESALKKGCNVIDTSANYMDGQAESLIGEVLNQEVVWGDLYREELVLISKVGYIQGENLKIAQKREEEQQPFLEVVKYAPGIWHCIHPHFIRDQITRSLSRMHIDVLDIYLLHNPEYFLLNMKKTHGINSENISREFYKRIANAFYEMENLVDEGLIRFYGISSNTLPVDNKRPDFVRLERIWEVYKSVCSEKGISTEEGHFAVIQFPFNWIEVEAFVKKNNQYNNRQITVFELARELNLGILTNRPLNAFKEDKMFRLATYGSEPGIDYSTKFREELDKLEELENIISKLIHNECTNTQINRDVKLTDIFKNSETLRKISLQNTDVSQFNQLISGYFLPLFKIGEKTFLKQIPKENFEKSKAALEGYFYQFNCTAKILQKWIDQKNYIQIKSFEDKFDTANPALADNLSFSQKAIKVLTDVSYVDVVLNGMRTPDYVEDSMGIIKTDKINSQKLLV